MRAPRLLVTVCSHAHARAVCLEGEGVEVPSIGHAIPVRGDGHILGHTLALLAGTSLPLQGLELLARRHRGVALSVITTRGGLIKGINRHEQDHTPRVVRETPVPHRPVEHEAVAHVKGDSLTLPTNGVHVNHTSFLHLA